MRALSLSSPRAWIAIVCLLCLRTADAQMPPKPATPEEIKQYADNLGDQRFPVRQYAFDQLKNIGLDALPALREATHSQDPEVVHRAWRLIDGWAAEGKVPALLFQLESNHEPQRAAAAETLGKMGTAAKVAVPALTVASRDKSELVRCCAREAIKNIEATAELMLEVTCLDDQVKIGGEKRYLIEISNTGTAPATNARINALAPGNVTVVGVGGIDNRQDGQRIITVPTELPAGAKMRLEVRAKVLKKGNAPLTAELLADQLASPVRGADNLPAQTGTALPEPRFSKPTAYPAVPPPPSPR